MVRRGEFSLDTYQTLQWIEQVLWNSKPGVFGGHKSRFMKQLEANPKDEFYSTGNFLLSKPT